MASISGIPSKQPTRWKVRFRCSDGSAGARILYDLDAAERFRDYIHATSAEAALARLDEELGRPAAVVDPDTPTVHDWVHAYIEGLGSGDVTDGSRQQYHGYLRIDIDPMLGEIPIGDLTRPAVQEWVDSLTPTNSPKTIANKHSLLSASLKYAAEEGLIRKNVAYRVKPKVILSHDAEGDDDDDRAEQVVLTPAEFGVVLDAMNPHYRVMLEFLVETGCRFNEMAGLRPRDIDWETGLVHFWRNIRRPSEAGGNYTVGTTKTKAGERYVAVRQSLLERLDRSNKYVFVNTVGSPGAMGRQKNGQPGMMKINSFRTNVWNPRITRLTESGALPRHKKARLHDLRHTSASWLIDSGASPLEIQKRLGHKSITTTYNIYGHIFDKRDSDGKITAAFDRILGDGTPALKLVR